MEELFTTEWCSQIDPDVSHILPYYYAAADDDSMKTDSTTGSHDFDFWNPLDPPPSPKASPLSRIAHPPTPSLSPSPKAQTTPLTEPSPETAQPPQQCSHQASPPKSNPPPLVSLQMLLEGIPRREHPIDLSRRCDSKKSSNQLWDTSTTRKQCHPLNP